MYGAMVAVPTGRPTCCNVKVLETEGLKVILRVYLDLRAEQQYYTPGRKEPGSRGAYEKSILLGEGTGRLWFKHFGRQDPRQDFWIWKCDRCV